MEDSPVKRGRLQEILESLKGKNPDMGDEQLMKKAVGDFQAEKDQNATDDWLHEHINQPLADAGYPEVGAGISAVGSAAKSMMPKDESQYSMVGVPGGAINKALGEVEGLGSMNYGAMTNEAKAAMAAKRAASEANANVLDYSGKAGPTKFSAEQWAKLRNTPAPK